MTPHERFEQLFTDESASVLRYPAPPGLDAATACDRIGWQAEVG